MSSGAVRNPDTRTRILEAAEHVMRTKGFARTTTKEIAQAAGCSEGNLYNHFDSKESLFLAVMMESMPGFVPLIMTLHQQVGKGTVEGNLREVAGTAIAFYFQFLPIAAGVFATPGLREGIRARNAGPHRANQGLAAYLRREQELGRLDPGADPEAAAALLLGACQQRALYALFLGEEALSAQDEFVTNLMNTLMHGLLPHNT